MNNQEILNEASREYIDLEEYIKKLCIENHKESKTKEVLDSLDITLQVMLMYLSVSNLSVPDIELTFIRLLTTEKDIIDAYNLEKGTKYSWDNIREKYMEASELKKFINDSYAHFKADIDKLIGFLSGCDSLTKEDNLLYIENKLRIILTLFTQISNDTDLSYIDLILNEVFVNKYKSLKDIFSHINFSL